MFDFDDVKKKLDKIIKDPGFDGDFGGPVKDRDMILSDIEDDSIKSQFPGDYLMFVQNFGTGQLGYSFFIDPKPIPHEILFGRNIPAYDGMYIFGSDLSEVVYAFDSNREWKVVEIDSEYDDIIIVSNSFSEFIVEKIEKII